MDGRDDGEVRSRLLAGLNAAQERAVTSPAASLVIIAGAGSGKTRVLTHRIARRVLDDEVDARRVLALTFTRKAAAELRQRLGRLGLPHPVHAGTFHAVAYAQLRQRWQERGITPPQLLDRKVGMVARCMGSSRSKSSPTLALDVTAEIEWAKARMIPADRYPHEAARAGRRPPIDADRVARAYAAYEDEKLARRMVDFDDLLRLATRDLRVDEQYAAARRWTFRHLFVDELQDVNPLQFELLRQWRGEPDADTDICVVGDPNQAIYSWNGADASYLDDAATHFPGAEVVELSDNYRSTPQILGVANTVLSSPAGPGRPGRRALQLRPNRGDGPLPQLHVADDEVGEARDVARRVRDRRAPGRPWSDQAVLVRTNAQIATLVEAFQKAGIPTRSRANGRLLDQPEVKDALRAMRAGSGTLAERLAELDRSLTPTTTAAEVLGEEPPPGRRVGVLNEERTANVAEIVRLGREYLDLDPQGGPGTFEAWLISTLRADDTGGQVDAVDLAPFHAAEGLEWSIVHIAGLEDGLVPIHYAQTGEAQAEERRLLYVALTRAGQELHCSRAERRAFGAKSLPRRPSPYLETIELALELLSDGHDPVELSGAVAEQRARLRSQDGVEPKQRRRRRTEPVIDLTVEDRRLLDALKAWRLQQARVADVPAFVIFNDATLTEVARRRPSNQRELLAIPGIGAVKAERFGRQLLKAVAETT
jgi:DNA helicase-2/ATP-dependent DNA helicase PcrA